MWTMTRDSSVRVARVVEPLPNDTDTTAGTADTDAREETVKPSGPAAPIVVRIATPAGYPRNAVAKSLAKSWAEVGAGFGVVTHLSLSLIFTIVARKLPSRIMHP
jgi:hypothetical protein